MENKTILKSVVIIAMEFQMKLKQIIWMLMVFLISVKWTHTLT